MPGKAQPKATLEAERKHDRLTYHEIPGADLKVSEVGFGCYRVDVSVEEHQEALSKALLEGVNIIDTSTNYADGGSEKLVGAVLAKLTAENQLSRESVVVVTKAGYLQGGNYRLSQERKREGNPYPELVELGQGLEHCIHPSFLEDQISASLDRLGLETIDVFLLHNPEYYLEWASRSEVPLTEARTEYYRRIGAAFRHLETEVEKGRIGCYGISSNTFPYPQEHPEFSSVEAIWNLAESMAPSHHFRVVELPLNLLETGAITEKNQPGGLSAVDFAREHGLAVLINRPLNALAERRLVRLADVAPVISAGEVMVKTKIRDLKASEERLTNELLPEMNFKPSLQKQLADTVAVGGFLADHWKRYGDLFRWQEIQTQFIIPKVQSVVQFLAGQELSDENIERIETHVQRVQEALFAVTTVYQAEAAKQCAKLKTWLGAVDADWASAETLSGMAVRALRSTPGVTSVLVGMRRDAYVDDVLRECARPVERSREREDSWKKAGDTAGSIQ